MTATRSPFVASPTSDSGNRTATTAAVHLAEGPPTEELNRTIIRQGRVGTKAEIRATLTGTLHAGHQAYGDSGAYRAEPVVRNVRDIEVRPIPTYDYRPFAAPAQPACFCANGPITGSTSGLL
jgi:hypothetical protein